jgi:hypothetical protein
MAIPHHLLGAEAEYQPGDARPGQQGPEPKPEHMQHPDGCDQPDRH